ncbi:MAG: YiiX/YebB-like N1pC/P60 family cysteine hydrolase [Aliiglaciecola sp.]|uniref:YiiX/YebB-like N1pC/P60 family cysteine hydrolase n=1 Tax=Aliiglaciecola sp. TaxID=1872441 RepID=UPI0032972054
MSPLTWIGDKIAHFLQKPSPTYQSETTCEPEALIKTLKKGDVLLIDGISRVSTAIKYLTQSSWSHATLCISDQYGVEKPDIAKVQLLEADVVEGVRVINLQEYVEQGTRICRPVSLNQEDIEKVIAYGKQRIGHQYDTKNILDLARYLIQTPPVPVGWRRNMLSLGSGDPTRAICSSLLAQGFQSIGYPILPQKVKPTNTSGYQSKLNHFFQSRHHTLFVPRDFDISPYFAIIKPTIEQHFDPYTFNWDSETKIETENQPPAVASD